MQAAHIHRLTSFVAGCFEELRALDERDLLEHHEPPHAGLACGAAGVAYALLRAGAPVEESERWVRAAFVLARRPRAFAIPGLSRAQHSFYHGLPGIWFVRALVARAAGGRALGKAIGGYVDACRVTRATPLEAWTGAAGLLAGAALLLDVTGDRRVRDLGARLSASLAAAATARPPDHVGLAHGRAGIYRALLLWSRRSGSPLPAWFFPALRRLPAAPPRDGRWCNGAAGLALLWVDAYEATREAAFLRAARRDARRAFVHHHAFPDLCCGSAGGALALLAVDRADPERGWRERALTLLLASIVSAQSSSWPHALLKGDAGLVCAALTLLSGTPGLPFLDG